MIELDKLYTIEWAETLIPVEALEAAQKTLPEGNRSITSGFRNIMWEATHNVESPWRKWKIMQGPNKGNWPTRFRNYFFTYYRTKLDDNLVSSIGATITRYRLQKPLYFMEIGKPTWEHASFGDAGSCWYVKGERGNDIYKRLQASKNGYAVKFYKDEDAYNTDKNRGIGRAWCHLCKDGGMVTFNYRGANETTYSKIISSALGLPAHYIGVSIVDGYTDGGGYYFGENRITEYEINYESEDDDARTAT